MNIATHVSRARACASPVAAGLTLTAAVAVLAWPSAEARAADLPNKDVAAALRSLVEAERSVYAKLIEQRAKAHGCKVAKDLAALKADEAQIPNVADFQTIVATAVRALDGGRHATSLDADALAGRSGGASPQAAADLLHAYADTSRTSYTVWVIARASKSRCGKPSEEWMEENGLPLPAQFTRATADAVRKAGRFTYTLQSEWPINKQNAPRTDFERSAVKAVQAKKPVYGEEQLAGRRYASAAYADVAVNGACVSCHNDHTSSPRKDFKLHDVMGSMIVRLPVN
ncbi:MAG: hypothetical protein RLY71_4517 [Pseudomonadota bacterium]|jgi:hypothetical protein